MNKRCNKKIRMLIFFILSFLPAILCGLLYAAILSSSSLVRSNTENQNLSDITSNKNTKKSSGNYSDKKQLLTDADNQTEPWSDAFNFDKTWNTQTDPRTGILTVFIKVGSMISNLGHGPDIALKINYSSGSTANPDALGAGWSWNLTHFNVRANQLTTSTGQSFHLQREADNKWKPLYHKLKDIDIRNNTRNGLIITYANGLREILNNEGYEIRLEQQNGNAVNFFYAPGTHLLTSINDNQNHCIKIIYHENYIIVISQGTEGQPVKVRINNSNNQLQSIVLPVQNSLNESGIYIIYKGHLITELDYPTGLKKIFSYNCTNAIRMMTTGRRANISLCAVSSETVITGINQPPLVTHYAYSETNTNNHNYLGFNSGLSPAADYSGRDRLFEVPADYTYQTLEDNQLVKEIRTYNKYHLLINDKKISDRTGHTLSEINNFYCRADQRNSCAHTTFKDLPATYALPLKTVTKVWGDNDGKPDISTVSRIYDESGRTIRYEDDYGRVVKTIYCPIKGDAACPAVSKEWMFSILPESMTVYPSKKITSRQHVATLPVTTYDYYRRESNRNGGGYILVLDHQIHQSGNAQIVAHRYYYHDSYNALTYGLLQKTTVKKIHNNSSQLPERIRHYYYTKDRDNYSKTFYSTIELEKGKLQRFPEVTTSLFTNQILQKSNITGTNITRYHYDTYGRLIQQDIAVHTPFAAYVHYKYTVSPVMNQVLITAANGLQYKVIFDSTGRKLQQWNETVSVSGRAEPGQWLLKKQFDYDRYGHLAKVYGYMVNALKKTDKLMTTYNYDEMGLVTQIKLPDGQRVFKLYNDSKRCMIHYRMNRYNQRSAVSVVHYNVLNKPIEQITLPAFQGALSAVKRLCQQKKWQQEAKVIRIAYDGFGRVVSTTNPAGRTITKTYNSLGEVALIKDSSGHEMYYSYDLTGHLIHAYKKYKTSAGFDGWLMYSAQYNPAGQLMWRRNASQQQTTYTYNTDGNLITIVTPAGHIISFQYNLLGLPVAKYIDEKLYLKSDYNPVTSLLIKKTDSTGITRYVYDDDGALQQEIHTGQNGDRSYKLQWFYDLNRRVIAVTDIDGNKTLTKYDSLGRITALYYQTLQNRRQLLTESVYDDFSRASSIRYGSGMQRSIDYDGYGRRRQVKDILNNQLLFQWNYTYDAVNNIISLKQQGKNNKTSWLNYRYDTQNNLIAMTCHGSAGLPLCPRDSAFTGSGLNNAPVIIRQNYYFNPLNRMTELKEVLQNSSATTTLSKVISYHYYDNIPLRFQSVSTRWNNNAPVVRGFNYDTAGNMITDAQGNQITYNPLNQITSVITIQGEHSCYGYNGSDKEVMEKTPFSIHHLFYRGRHLINESIYSYQNQTTYM
ncbi:MAG: hypothetical protein OXC48_09815, partial [Endozoicomonadaceae bacterium]|nr:hypothetical protein [Endozoicomonadaceae bacterium]